MKAKHWLLAGVGCLATSIVLGIAMGLYWMGQIRAFASDFDSGGTPDPFRGFGVVMIIGGVANLLFFGGIIVLIIGFIKLAKEPSGDARKADATQERPGSG
jgi:hypothetical protein